MFFLHSFIAVVCVDFPFNIIRDLNDLQCGKPAIGEGAKLLNDLDQQRVIAFLGAVVDMVLFEGFVVSLHLFLGEFCPRLRRREDARVGDVEGGPKRRVVRFFFSNGRVFEGHADRLEKEAGSPLEFGQTFDCFLGEAKASVAYVDCYFHGILFSEI